MCRCCACRRARLSIIRRHVANAGRHRRLGLLGYVIVGRSLGIGRRGRGCRRRSRRCRLGGRVHRRVVETVKHRAEQDCCGDGVDRDAATACGAFGEFGVCLQFAIHLSPLQILVCRVGLIRIVRVTFVSHGLALLSSPVTIAALGEGSGGNCRFLPFLPCSGGNRGVDLSHFSTSDFETQEIAHELDSPRKTATTPTRWSRGEARSFTSPTGEGRARGAGLIETYRLGAARSLVAAGAGCSTFDLPLIS